MTKFNVHIVWFFLGIFIFGAIAMSIEIGDDSDCPDGFGIYTNDGLWICADLSSVITWTNVTVINNRTIFNQSIINSSTIIADSITLNGRTVSNQEFYNDVDTTGLLHWYTLDSHVLDKMGSEHGSRTGTQNITGVIDKGIEFDGVNDFVDLGNDISMLENVIGDYTICAWNIQYGLNTNGGECSIFGASVGATNRIDMRRGYGHDGFYFASYDASSSLGRIYDTTVASIKQNEWVHLCFTHKANGRSEVFINGINETAAATINIGGTGIYNDMDSFTIGARDDDGTDYYTCNGSVDEVLLFNRSITSVEAQKIYMEGRRGENALVDKGFHNVDVHEDLSVSGTASIEGDTYTADRLAVGTSTFTNNVQTYIITPQSDWPGTFYGLFSRARVTTSGTNSRTGYGTWSEVQIFGTGSHTGTRYGLNAVVTGVHTGTVTMAQGGRYDIVGFNSPSIDGNYTNAYGLATRFQPYYSTYDDAHGLHIYSPINIKGKGAIKNLIGLKVDDLIVCNDSNFAIQTGKGAVEFGDNVNITANLTTDLIYGELTGSNRIIDIISTDTYVAISPLNATFLNGFTFDGNYSLTAQYGGMYQVSSQYAFSGTPNNEYHLALAVNGNRIATCHTERVIGSGGDVGSASITCLCPMNRNDVISVEIENTDSNGDPTVHDFNLNLVRVGHSTS